METGFWNNYGNISGTFLEIIPECILEKNTRFLESFWKAPEKHRRNFQKGFWKYFQNTWFPEIILESLWNSSRKILE